MGLTSLTNVEPESALSVAVRVAFPELTLVAKPPLVTLRMLEADELQLTDAVKSSVDPLVKIPLAENCCAMPTAIVGFAGDKAIEVNAGGVTVRLALALMLPELAVTEVVP